VDWIEAKEYFERAEAVKAVVEEQEQGRTLEVRKIGRLFTAGASTSITNRKS
jgi:hypothetical protein